MEIKKFINQVFGFYLAIRLELRGNYVIGKHNCNIYNLELVDKKEDYLSFIFDVKIKNLKDFTNLISDLKLNQLILK